MHYLLEMRDILKEFPGVKALQGVNLQLAGGEVHALVGENGAGKSTLMKILGGAYRKDGGEILIDGKSVEITSPHDSQCHGISVIYQEFNLIPQLNVAENIFLGREPRSGMFINRARLNAGAQLLLQQLGMDLDMEARVQGLSIAQQQMVEIAKAISVNARIIVMDEPSATLTDHELKRLFVLIRQLKKQGVGIIYISHRLEELFEIADRVTVMRDGRWIMSDNLKNVTRDRLVNSMVGRDLKDEFAARPAVDGPGEELLRVEGIRRAGVLHDISFTLKKGEILGISGLVGAGRTELARAIFGADPIDGGSVFLKGKKLRIRSPHEAIRHGICLVTEDRKNQGLVLAMSVRENITMANLGSLLRYGTVDARRENAVAEQFVSRLGIKTPGIGQRVKNLSGGNQQKVVLAKWLFARSRLVIFDEPTRGIDVGAKQEIYRLMTMLAKDGVGVIMISSELPEVLGMSDRIIVMREGRVRAELPRTEATQEKVMHYAATISND